MLLALLTPSPMVHLLDLGRPDPVAYRVSDVLTEEDVQTVTQAFDDLLASSPDGPPLRRG